MATIAGYKFFSLVEELFYHYKPGDYQVPLYDEHYKLHTSEEFGEKWVTAAIRRSGTKSFVALEKLDYEIKSDLLVYNTSLYEGDTVRWSFYGQEITEET